MTDFAWNSESCAMLELLWRDGASATECAVELACKLDADVSRNAVIGKVHRLKLNVKYPRARVATTGRVRNPRVRAVTVVRVRTARGRVEVRKPVFVERRAPPTAPPPRLIPLADLRPCHCRWPLGDPRRIDFAFCGCDRPTVELLGKTEPDPRTFYCDFHTHLARA